MERQLKQNYTCRICGESFDTAEDLDAHNVAIHGQRLANPQSGDKPDTGMGDASPYSAGEKEADGPEMDEAEEPEVQE